MTKPSSRIEAALQELCVTYGYCLTPDAQDEILAAPPSDLEGFVDAVLRAEGWNVEFEDSDLKAARREVGEVVRAWLFDEGRGRGTKSGLPRLPND